MFQIVLERKSTVYLIYVCIYMETKKQGQKIREVEVVPALSL